MAVKREMVDGGEEGGGLVDGGARATAERHAGKTHSRERDKGRRMCALGVPCGGKHLSGLVDSVSEGGVRVQ